MQYGAVRQLALEIINMGVVDSAEIERAIALKIEGDYDGATTELKHILEASPDHPVAHHQLGLIYGFTGEFDESIAELEKAIGLDEANLVCRNDLALTQSMLGMYDEAKAGFEYVLSVDPENDVAKKNMAFFA